MVIHQGPPEGPERSGGRAYGRHAIEGSVFLHRFRPLFRVGTFRSASVPSIADE